jgi:2'-5' RNA ligase
MAGGLHERRNFSRSQTSNMKKRAIVYWLIPAAPQRELFRELIRILAKQFDAPRFEPHLTIIAAPEDRVSPGKILRAIKATPIRLKVRDISFSTQFTKSLFARFTTGKAFEKLAADLAHATGSRAKSPAQPHVSLLYKKLPATSKKQLASAIKLPFREIVFDSIKAVRCAWPTKTRAEVESWRVLAAKNLNG